jgi:ABC-2 type transport system ATP-binding protein
MEHGTIRQQGPLREVLDAYKGRSPAVSGG